MNLDDRFRSVWLGSVVCVLCNMYFDWIATSTNTSSVTTFTSYKCCRAVADFLAHTGRSTENVRNIKDMFQSVSSNSFALSRYLLKFTATDFSTRFCSIVLFDICMIPTFFVTIEREIYH